MVIIYTKYSFAIFINKLEEFLKLLKPVYTRK